jgi:hypothetical protein
VFGTDVIRKMKMLTNNIFSMSVIVFQVVKLKEQMFQIMTVNIHFLIRCVHQVSVSLLVLVLEVLLSCFGYLPHHVQKDMLNELVDRLCNCSVQRELIRLSTEIAVQLTHHLAESKKEARKKVKSWTGDVLQVRFIFFLRTGI